MEVLLGDIKRRANPFCWIERIAVDILRSRGTFMNTRSASGLTETIGQGQQRAARTDRSNWMRFKDILAFVEPILYQALQSTFYLSFLDLRIFLSSPPTKYYTTSNSHHTSILNMCKYTLYVYTCGDSYINRTFVCNKGTTCTIFEVVTSERPNNDCFPCRKSAKRRMLPARARGIYAPS